jgi:hypothetical protein
LNIRLSRFYLLQLAYPGYYRELGLADAYFEINFGLLDLVMQDGQLQVEVSVVSHRGERVLQKVVPLRARQLAPPPSQLRVDTVAGLLDRGDAGITCVPYWGKVPLWRRLVYKGIIALAILVCALMPAAALLWLVGASIYYVLFGAEKARREGIERRYQEHKKRD